MSFKCSNTKHDTYTTSIVVPSRPGEMWMCVCVCQMQRTNCLSPFPLVVGRANDRHSGHSKASERLLFNINNKIKVFKGEKRPK